MHSHEDWGGSLLNLGELLTYNILPCQKWLSFQHILYSLWSLNIWCYYIRQDFPSTIMEMYQMNIISWLTLDILSKCRRFQESHCTVTTHHSDVIMSSMATQITGVSMVYSTHYSDADPRKHQSSASLAFVRGIHRWPVNSLHKGPVMWKIFSLDEVIMGCQMLVKRKVA